MKRHTTKKLSKLVVRLCYNKSKFTLWMWKHNVKKLKRYIYIKCHVCEILPNNKRLQCVL